MKKSDSEFNLSAEVGDPAFLDQVSSAQRRWLIKRFLDETEDELHHMDRLADRFVPGSQRRRFTGPWECAPANVSDTGLSILGQQVMQTWEHSLMKAMADTVCEQRGDVLEIGFGLGISAEYIRQNNVRSHTIIECNNDVVSVAAKWKDSHPTNDIRLINARWQDVIESLGDFDGIFFDPYPMDEGECAAYFSDSIVFAECFVREAVKHLKKAGTLTYLSNEIDSISRRHQRLILDNFGSVEISLVRDLKPGADCNYWWAESMAVIKAVK